MDFGAPHTQEALVDSLLNQGMLEDVDGSGRDILLKDEAGVYQFIKSGRENILRERSYAG